jgi:hypothetical protein
MAGKAASRDGPRPRRNAGFGQGDVPAERLSIVDHRSAGASRRYPTVYPGSNSAVKCRRTGACLAILKPPISLRRAQTWRMASTT